MTNIPSPIMKKRVTVLFEEDVLKKLRDLQAKKIKNTKESVSFSALINEVVRNGKKYHK